MSFQLQNKLTGGLDQDSDSRFVAETDWRMSLNIRGGIAYAGKLGVVTNVNGNEEIPYTLPAGTNKCIGAYSDVQANTVIYFIYNSNGNHQILRYFISEARIDLQMEYDFGWTADTNITGIELINGRLLYWNDPKPRKINIEKARYILPDGTQKVKEWSLVLPKTISNLTAPYELYFKNKNGTLIFGSVFDPTAYANREEFIQAIAAALNLVSSQSPVNAEACDCSLKLTEKVGGTVWTIESNNPTIVIPVNWYGLTITDRMVDRAKYPPLYEPIGEYQQDDNYLYNYVKNKVFQFRLQYRYDDFENSALGVISQIPIDNLQCDGTNNPDKNYIGVDFNDPALLDQLTYSILTDVKVLAREQNDGNWKEIIQLSPCEFLDYNGMDWVASYNFYNDIVSNTVADADVAKQYDDVPLTAEENILVKNRAILANVVKGYDAPDCIPATWDVDVAEATDVKLYNVTGKIRILTYGLAKECAEGGGGNNIFEYFFPTDRKYPYWKPPFVSNMQKPIGGSGVGQYSGAPLLRGGIFHDITRTSNDFAFFGGGSYDNNGNFGIRSGMEDTFDQRIPERGFPIYAANTQYLAISKQVQVGLPTDGLGALDTSSATKVEDIGNYLYNPNGVPFDLYSTFNLKLPNGVYVIRLASHWCSYGDKLEKGFNYDLNNGTQYQKTSTNIWAVIDAAGNWLQEKELTITVNNGDVYIGEFIVADLAPPHHAEITGSGDTDYWQAINGYLVDSFGATNPNDANFSGIPVEKTLVSVCGYIFTGAISTPLPITGITELGLLHSRSCITDHNGYFFQIGGVYVNGDAPPDTMLLGYNQMQITALNSTGKIRRMDTVIGVGTISDYYNKALDLLNFDGSTSYGVGLVYGVVTTNDFLARASARIINGYVLDTNGDAVSLVNVVYENGQVTTTNTSGFYGLIAWFDAKTAYQGNFSLPSLAPVKLGYGRTVDDLIFNALVFCGITYPYGQTYNFSLAQGTIGYNDPREIPDFIVDESNSLVGKAHKRGGKYTYGIRYYDENGRFCSVVKAFEMYLPFVTQDLNVLCIQDNYDLPNQYPVGTFKYGKPTINWHIAASQKAPEWAHYYQWVRTKNSIYGRYLQWEINSVTYLSSIATTDTPEIITSYFNFDAVAIKISISNIIDYAAKNPESQIGYTFQEGDRIRIIANRDIVYLNSYIDLNVISYDIDTQSLIVKIDSQQIEIKSGMLIEIMNPLSIVDNEEQIYYEVGEVYPCTAPNTPNNQHSLLNGTFTNGDTYWRGRLIPVNDDATNFAAIYPVVIEDASVSDFYPSNSQDIGRAGVIDPNFKQIHYPTMMQHSGIYVEGSALNGLSSFETYNYKELNRAFGGIKRLFYVGNTLLSIHENKVVANYIELRSLSDANTTDGLLAVSDAYFGNDRPMQSEYGCQHPNSAVQYNGYVYFLDASKGVVCRTDNNGLDSISDIKMRSFFRQLCSEGVESSVATFDPYYREYVITITTPEQTKTIAWNEDKNRWITLYSFAPERYSSVLRSIVSFKDGKLWLHDVNPTYNNFYGVQHRTELTVIPHTDNTKQTFHTVLLQGNQANPLANDWAIEEIANDYGQRSRLKKQHFRLKENFWCASFLRDITDTTVTDPIINGRNLRGQELVCKFVNDSEGIVSLQQIITTIVPSERTPK